MIGKVNVEYVQDENGEFDYQTRFDVKKIIVSDNLLLIDDLTIDLGKLKPDVKIQLAAFISGVNQPGFITYEKFLRIEALEEKMVFTWGLSKAVKLTKLGYMDIKDPNSRLKQEETKWYAEQDNAQREFNINYRADLLE